MNLLFTVVTTVLVNFSISGCAVGEGTQEVNLTGIQEGTAIATFAGGCFWCTEAVFERVTGVTDVVSGYTGGSQENPTYRQVSYGQTDHLEAIQIYYDPEVVSYRELLEIFFVAGHYPTQSNGQGPDLGGQYLSAVFAHDDAQKKAAKEYIAELDASGKYDKKIFTKVRDYDKFWLAEDYHQDYYELNPGNPYIINIAKPKVKKLKKYFPNKVKEKYKSE